MASDSDKPEAVAMWCGPAEGVTLAYQCRSCGVESDDIEDFNVSTCWGCCERAYWGDLCQLERHGECANGDPDSAEFCPCPCHDEDSGSPAFPLPPDRAAPGSPVPFAAPPGPVAVPAGPGTPDASALPPSPPGGGAGGGPAEPHLSEAPARRSPRGVARRDTAAAPLSPARGAAAPLDPVPPLEGGTGSGQVEPPPRRLAPSRTAPGGCTPGATAGASPRGEDAPAVKTPSPSPTPDPQGGRDGEGLDPASDGNAASALAGQDWGVFVDEVRLLAIGGEGAEWWAVYLTRQHPSRLTCLEMTLPGGSWHVACDCEEDAAMLRDLMTGRGMHPATVKVARLADCIAGIERRKAAREARARSMEQVHGAQMQLNAEKRNQRGKPWTARKATRGAGPGMARRMPEKPTGGDAA